MARMDRRRGRDEEPDAFWRKAIWLAVGLGMMVCGCRSEPRLTPQQAEGKHLYEVRCAHCHEENDLHLKKVPPDLHPVFKHATLPGGGPATDAEVRRVVLAG